MGRGRGAGRGRAASRGAGQGRAGRQGGARGRGVGRGSGRGQANPTDRDAAALAPCGWDDADNDVSGETPAFTPNRPAGPNFPDNFAPQRELDFFRLFFSVTVIQHLVHSTNLYAWKRICQGDGLT